MDTLLSVGGLGLIIVLVIAVVTIQHYQQNAQYREIQDRLREIRQLEQAEQRALAMRRERAGFADPLNVLEASMYESGRTELTPEELVMVDEARAKIKDINMRLTASKQWMGVPFDLEWTEILDRIPLVRGAYLAAGFDELPVSAATPSATLDS